MKFKLPQLPYQYDALSPNISEETLRFHYDKHHTGYINALNELVLKNQIDIDSIEDIFLEAGNKIKNTEDSRYLMWNAIFNNAGQVINHTFFWKSLSPKSEIENIDSKLIDRIILDFGTVENLRNLIVEIGISQFGSGWVWLIWNIKEKKLEVVKTSNAHSPILGKHIPLFVCDVWEHAYYLDYQNRRKDFLDTVVKKNMNWKFISESFNNI